MTRWRFFWSIGIRIYADMLALANLKAFSIVYVILLCGVASIGLCQASSEPNVILTPALEQGATLPSSTADLATRLLDSVVSISTTQLIEGTEQGDDIATLDIDPKAPFQDYFKDFFDPKSGPQERSVEWRGSGFVIDATKGLIVTNAHVIEDAHDISVIFTNGMVLKAKLLGKDVKTDLALLQVEGAHKPLIAAEFGDSDKARIGDWVMAIGNPFGLNGSVTLGIISARHRDISSGPYDDYIQTDATINRGNSGGPLFDMKGQVIGVNTAIYSLSGGSVGIGFAIPSNIARGILRQLEAYGEVRRGWLAVRLQSVTPEVAQIFGLEKPEGALVSGKIAGGDADNKALKLGDIIVCFDGQTVREAHDLSRLAAASPVGKRVEIVLMRDGVLKKVNVTLGRLPEAETDQTMDDDAESKKPLQSDLVAHFLGMTLVDLSDDLRKRYKIKDKLEGVVVSEVVPHSAAADKRIAVGEVILEINQNIIKTVGDAKKRIDALRGVGRKNALLLVARPDGEVRFVTVQMN